MGLIGKSMTGIQNIDQLLSNMTPELNKGKYVFVSIQNLTSISSDDVICLFRESEGITIILDKNKADELNLTYNFVAAWITLTVHSSLNAVGLTAAFSSELASHGISCNVVAGFYHDHIFVDYNNADKALSVLNQLSQSS